MRKSSILLFVTIIFILISNKVVFSQCPPSGMLDSAWAETPTLISSTCLYDTAFAGQIKVYVLALKVKAKTCSNTIKIDSIFVSTTGSTSPLTDIANLNIYSVYAAPFNDANKIYSVALPNGKVRIKPTGGWTVTAGVNTIYVAYDLSYTGVIGDVVDCSFDSLYSGGYKYVPVVKNPAGNTKLVNNANYDLYCGVTRVFSGNFNIGTRNITFGTINNYTPTCTGPMIYNFYPQTIPTFYKQTTYPISIITGELNSPQYACVYIDWNNDGYFTSSELAYNTPGLPVAGYITGSITIPCNASPGIHRMRVTSDYNFTPGFCGSIYYGECEDYLINIALEAAPIVYYKRDSIGYTGGVVTFTPVSNIGGNITFRWDTNNDGIWDATRQTGLFIFNTPGIKTVRMQAVLNGCTQTIFSNTYIDSIDILNTTSKTKIDFIADQNTVTPNIPVHFRDLSTYGPYKWKWNVIPDSLNGWRTWTSITPSDTDRNPVILFSQPGTFSVRLICTNKAGVDTLIKLKYITVVKEMRECSDFYTTLPEGFLYDDGGKNAGYSNPSFSTTASKNEQYCDFVIHPNCAKTITLTFDQFDVDALRVSSCPLLIPDFLAPYDGKDSTGTALYLKFVDTLGNPVYPFGFMNQQVTNLIMGVPPATIALSGYMCIQWHRNCLAFGQGFEAKWTTQFKTENPPHAIIASPDTFYTGTKANFHSASVAYQPSYQWDFNNDNVWDASDSMDSWTYLNPGSYTVRLAINSCQQLDTATKRIIVKNPVNIPVVNFTSDYTRIATKNKVQFTDLSDNSVYQWLWRFSRNKAIFVDGTDSLSENPHVKFSDTGYFDVTLFATNEKGTNSLIRSKYIYVYKYCTPVVLNLSSDLGMSQVTLTDVNNNNIINNPSSIGSSGYSDYSNNLVTIYRGATYQLTLKRITSLNNITWNVWIDYNQDGIFASYEMAGVLNNSPAVTWTTSFTVPAAAYSGITYMRIAANTGAIQSVPCGPNFIGEFEDYGFMVLNDTIKPVITLAPPDTIVLSSCGKFVEPGYSAWDPVFGLLTNNVVRTGTYDSIVPGIYPISYNVTDNEGNDAITQTRYIKITADVIPPYIKLYGNNPDSVPVFASYVDPGHKDTDDCSGIALDSVFSNVNKNKIGTYNIVYTAKDKAGNVTTAIRKVKVYDDIPPVIHLVGSNPDYVEVHTPYIEDSVKIIDNYNLHLLPKIKGTVDTSLLGYYFLSYCATDSSGNGPICVTRTVIVQDTIPPVLTLIGGSIITVNVFTQFVDPGYTVHDNYYPDSDIIVKITGTVNTFVIGNYYLYYQATDASQNKSIILRRTVRVIDSVAPVIQLNGLNPMTLQRWAVFTDPGVTDSDNYYPSNQLIVHYNEDGSFENTLNDGIYSYTYRVCDPSANCSNELTRTIIVIDNDQTLGMIGSAGGYYLKYYPNPVNNILNIDIGFDKITRLFITIYDAVGKLVMSSSQGEIISRHIPVNISNLSSGIYSIKFTMGTTEITRKLIIAK